PTRAAGSGSSAPPGAAAAPRLCAARACCPAVRPYLLQSALVHVNSLLVQKVLAEPAWAKKLTDEDRRGLTALFWSNVNPYGTVHLDMDKRLDLGSSAMVPRQGRAAGCSRPRSRSVSDP
ncbi:Tn3 family transposase, partial [Streptomyces sp. NPDC055134]